MKARTENYHGIKVPYDENGLLNWGARDADGNFLPEAQAAYDRYIDAKVKHDGLWSLTDYQAGNWIERHPDRPKCDDPKNPVALKEYQERLKKYVATTVQKIVPGAKLVSVEKV